VLNLDLTNAITQEVHNEHQLGLYRPGLRIARVRLWLGQNASERFWQPATASIRLYDEGPDDYGSQSTVASSRGAGKLSLSESREADFPVADEPGTVVLRAKTSKESVVRATYPYSTWTPGQLVLRGYCLSQQSGRFTADVTYSYAGRRFVKTGIAVSSIPEREPYGLAPLELGDSVAWENTEIASWSHLTIDLRGVLPDLARSSVESVVVNLTLDAGSDSPMTFVFGPMIGYGNAAFGRPLTPLAAGGKLLQPRAVRGIGTNALVDFGNVAGAPPNLDVTSAPLGGNVPSAIRFGAPLVTNATTAEGALLDPTLGSISTSSNGIVELGTMFNKGWVLRQGAPRAAAGPFRELGAWISTRPFTTTHFVGEGFTNAWAVPAGTYTAVFLPQVVRDLSTLILAVVLALGVAGGLLFGLFNLVVRRRSATR
jgi:hypothetical protein